MTPNGATVRRLRLSQARTNGAAPQTLVEFADAIGLSPSYLSRIETGQRTDASFATMSRIADGLGVPLAAVATDDLA